MSKCTTKRDALRMYVSTDALIKYTLNEKYNNFENASLEKRQAMKSFC